MSSTETDIEHDVGGVCVEEVDLHVARENLDALAQRFLGLSGAEFLAKRASGDLDELRGLPAHSRVEAVAGLLG